MRASPNSLPISGSARPGKASCQRISITRQKPNKRNSRPVNAYWMPMTLWSVENTYWRQKPRCSCPACSCSASWAGAVSSVAMALPESLSVIPSSVRLLGRRREREIGGARLVGGDGHLRGLGPELLVPGLDLVGARRQARDLVLAVRA